jgi:hypothetical protein
MTRTRTPTSFRQAIQLSDLAKSLDRLQSLTVTR